MTDQTLADVVEGLTVGAGLVNCVGTITFWSGRTIEQEGTEWAITYTGNGELIKLRMREATDYRPGGGALGEVARGLIAAAAGNYRHVCQLSEVAERRHIDARRFFNTVHESLLRFFDDHIDGQGEDAESAFDDLLVELGLPGRTREYVVTARVTYEITATVTATSEDAAREAFDEDSHHYVTDNIDTSYWEELDIDQVELA